MLTGSCEGAGTERKGEGRKDKEGEELRVNMTRERKERGMVGWREG